ncbi:MAG: 3-isopropylmalate dehydrogenase, partial [Prevotellaceae bacterium]|nr:3-isopropylmalate dehydrogenase [Prevotellaceae bacterium]
GSAIRQAVAASMAAGVVTEDIAEQDAACRTSEVGDWVANEII